MRGNPSPSQAPRRTGIAYLPLHYGKMPLGYPDEQPVARERKELKEFVFLEKYGQGES